MQDRLRRLARAVAGSVPGRRRSRRSEDRSGSRSDDGPLLSVVVTARDVEDHIDECLANLARQTLDRLQIILVDDGSSDGTGRRLAEFANRDPRAELISRSTPQTGAARNAGLALARAPYLAFLDGADTVTADGYHRLVTILLETGSDFAFGALQRLRNGRRTVPPDSAAVHDVERRRTSIEQFPAALHDLYLGNRVFRRAFWTERVGPFAEDVGLNDAVPRRFWNERLGPYEDGVSYVDQLPLVSAYLRADSIDVSTTLVSTWRLRQASAAGETIDPVADLRRRLALLQEVRHRVRAEASSAVQAAWLSRVFSVELPTLVPYALSGDPDYRAELTTALREHWDAGAEDALPTVRVERKLLLALVIAGSWTEVDALLEHTRLSGSPPSTVVHEGRVLADLSFGRRSGLPASAYELSLAQTRLGAAVCGLRWVDDGTLQIDGWAFVHGIDLTETVPELEVSLVELGGERRVVALSSEHRVRTDATRWADDPQQRYDQAGFRAVLPPGRLPGSQDLDGGRPRRWQLNVTTRVHGVARSGPVRTITRFGTADRLPSSPVTDPTDPTRVVITWSSDDGLVLEVRAEQVRAVTLSATVDGGLSGTLRVFGALRSDRVMLVDVAPVASAPLVAAPDGTFAFTVAVPSDATAPSLRLTTDDGRHRRVGWPVDRSLPSLVRVGEDGPAWQRSPRGNVQVLMPRPRCQVEAVTLDEEHLTLTLTTELIADEDLRVARLASANGGVTAAAVTDLGSGRRLLVFPVTTLAWPGDRERSPLPVGRYELTVPGDDTTVSMTADDALLEQLPLEMLTTRHGMTVTRAARSTRVQLVLRAPLAELERGRVARRRLEEWYKGTEFSPADQVFFQCYRGEVATDSQLALHEKLRERGTTWELVWGVAHRSVGLPDGARGVIVGSRDWYEALGRSRYLCSNVDFDRFFRRRDHQRFLQTFHGYPFKSMGVSFWRSKGFSEHAIAYECERRARAWTSILVPAAFCIDLYRDNYRWTGETLVTGYPRDDALAAQDPAARTRLLRRLGLASSQRIVLYAPTWREADAVTAWSARMFDELELERLADAVGDDHVILMRGHNRNLGRVTERVRAGRAGIVDVTDYPEINDLILAADVAVLDYSSLRFDWLITGKPMLFFVPDLEDYLSQRTGLFDFGPTAPGPLLRTTDEVIDALRDLARVSAAFAAERTTANARFNGLNDGRAAERVVDAFFADALPPPTSH